MRTVQPEEAAQIALNLTHFDPAVDCPGWFISGAEIPEKVGERKAVTQWVASSVRNH
jgi:hypothetical protein